MLQPITLAIVLAFLSALIHALGLLGLLYWQTRQWPQIEADFRPRRNLPVFLLLFGVILTLHLIEITFWFNRRTSASRGKLFYRLAQQAVQIEPIPFAKLVKPQPVAVGGVK